MLDPPTAGLDTREAALHTVQSSTLSSTPPKLKEAIRNFRKNALYVHFGQQMRVNSFDFSGIIHP